MNKVYRGSTISRLGNNDCDYVFNQGVCSLVYPKNAPVHTDWLLLFVYSYDNNPQYQIQFAANIHSSDIYIRNIEQYDSNHPNYHPHYPWFKVATDTTYVSPAAEEHVD